MLYARCITSPASDNTSAASTSPSALSTTLNGQRGSVADALRVYCVRRSTLPEIPARTENGDGESLNVVDCRPLSNDGAFVAQQSCIQIAEQESR